MSDVESLQSREVTISPVESSKIGLPVDSLLVIRRRIFQVGGTLMALLGLSTDSQPTYSQPVGNDPANSASNRILIIAGTIPSEEAYQQMITPYNPKPETGVLSSLSITDTLKPTLVSREWLEKNPLTITEIKDRVDASGNVIQQFVLKGGYLHESHLDPTSNQFTEFNLTSIHKVPMENPRTMAISADGGTILVGGEDPIRSAHTALTVSYDGGKSWKSLPWPYQDSGATSDILRVDETTYIGNNGNYEGGISQFIIQVNKTTQAASLKAVNLETIQKVSVNAGSARDLSVTSFDSSTRRVKIIGSNWTFGEWGLYAMAIDLNNNSGLLEKFNTVTIDGVQTNLGTVDTISTYVEQGRLKVAALNDLRQTVFYFDFLNKTGTQKNYAHLLDNKGIPNYDKGSLFANGVDVIVDNQGNKNTWLAGAYYLDTNPNGYPDRAVLVHLESGGVFYDLFPNTDDSLKFMYREKINGQLGYDGRGRKGKAFIPINADGSPIINAPVLYSVKGLNRPYTIALPVAMPVFTSQG